MFTFIFNLWDDVAVAEYQGLLMASIVLASSNHASFASSIWSDWARSPHDLLLVAEVSMKVFIGFLLPTISGRNDRGALWDVLPNVSLSRSCC